MESPESTLEVLFYDGDVLLHKVSVQKGEKVTIPSEPERNGYSFEGWYDAEHSRVLYGIFDSFHPTEEQYVFTACWCRNDLKDYFYTVGNILVSDSTVVAENVEIPMMLEGTVVKSIGYRLFEDNVFIETVTIPGTVVEIQSNAFMGCTFLKSVSLPSSITPDPKFLSNYIGSYAFYDCSSLEKIIIPKGVEIIEDYTFSGCTSLERVWLPSSVKKIENNAFENCSSLQKIELPDNLEAIGNFAFQDCTSLISISIPEGIEELSNFVFSGCSSLVEVNLPKSLKKIGHYSFSKCTSLPCIKLPPELRVLEEATFSQCSSLYYVELPDGIETISDWAFYDTDMLYGIRLPDSITEIGNSAFASSGLKAITLPNSLNYIGQEAFTLTDLKSISIPSNVSNIEADAFSSCFQLAEILVDDQNSFYSSIDGVLYDKKGENIIIWPEGKNR